jgi:hypothetical protein
VRVEIAATTPLTFSANARTVQFGSANGPWLRTLCVWQGIRS